MPAQRTIASYQFQTLDGSMKWTSKAKFLAYLKFDRGVTTISDHYLLNNYMTEHNGTFTIEGTHYVYNAVYGPNIYAKPKDVATEDAEEKTLIPATYTEIVTLAPGVVLELTKGSKTHNLLHTKSLAS